MTARDSLEQARLAVRRIAEIDAQISRLEDVGGCDPSAPMGHSSDPSWRIADAVAQAEELRRERCELEDVVDTVAAAIWRVDTGDASRDWEVGQCLTLLYLESLPRTDVATAIGGTVDRVKYLQRIGIAWLDTECALW